MKEIKLVINKKVNISELIINKFREIGLKEYYMREFKEEGQDVYFFVYELQVKGKYVTPVLKRDAKINVMTTIVATVKKDKTEVSFVVNETEKMYYSVVFPLMDYGFKVIE